MSESSQATPRLLVVEDEYLIRMLLEDMLADLGYDVAAAVGTIAEASALAANGDFDAAILDVNLDGQRDLSGRRHSGQARPALRVRHRLWRAQPAGALSRPPGAAEAVPGRAAQRRMLAAICWPAA